ncbi:conserved hypothetical protein, partial [Perkinsus marinus ATCC 50983]
PPSDLEIEEACKRLKNNKAAGIDLITGEIVKQSSTVRSELSVLIRGFWNGEEIDEECKTAILVPLFKNKGSRSDPKAYRGISLLPIIERIVSLIMLNRIQTPLECHLLPQQYGFIGGKSCRDPVRTVFRRIQNKGGYVSMFVDFQRAFDTLRWDSVFEILRWA